jgi:hypothetical protein
MFIFDGGLMQFSKTAIIPFLMLVLCTTVGHAGFRTDNSAPDDLEAGPAPRSAPQLSQSTFPAPDSAQAKRPARFKDGEIIVKFRPKVSEAGKHKVHQRLGSRTLKGIPAFRLHQVQLKQGLTVDAALRRVRSCPRSSSRDPSGR